MWSVLLVAIFGFFASLAHTEVANAQTAGSRTTIRHYLYSADGKGPVTLYVYDMDNRFRSVNRTTLDTPAASHEVRGIAISAATGMLYVSRGCFYDPSDFHYCNNGIGGYLTKYSVLTGRMIWDKNYPFGVDSFSITPDGQTIYMPVGEQSTSTVWEIIDANTGKAIATLDSGQQGPHNTIVSNSGAHVYLGPRLGSYLVVAKTSNNTVIRNIGPVLGNQVRPFTIDSQERWAFINLTGYLGFQIGDVGTGKILYTVPIAGFSGCQPGSDCSHGICLSPHDKEIYVLDSPNDYVHVFDVTGLPSSAPKQVADVRLAHHLNSPTWLTHSRDGRFVFVGGSGDVIDTATRQIVGYIPDLSTTKVYTEVDFQNGRVYFSPLSRSGVGYATSAAPIPAPPPGPTPSRYHGSGPHPPHAPVPPGSSAPSAVRPR